MLLSGSVLSCSKSCHAIVCTWALFTTGYMFCICVCVLGRSTETAGQLKAGDDGRLGTPSPVTQLVPGIQA